MPGASTEEKGFARAREPFTFDPSFACCRLTSGRRSTAHAHQSTTFSGQLRVLSAAVWPRVSSYSYNPLQ